MGPSAGDREKGPIRASVVSYMSEGELVEAAARVSRPAPPLAPVRGGFLVVWGLGQCAALLPGDSNTSRTASRRARKTLYGVADILSAGQEGGVDQKGIVGAAF